MMSKFDQLQYDIICAILGQPGQFHKNKKALRVEFFVKPWKRIMEGIWACAEQGVEINFVNIATLSRLSGGEQEELCSLKPSLSSNLPLLCRVLAEEVVRVKFFDFRGKITEEADAFELIDGLRKLEETTAAVIRTNTRRDKLDILNGFCDYLLTNSRDGVQRIATPFETLNRMLNGGLEAGGFTLLGGTPGSGKTSFMLSIALHAATSGVKVAFIEGEMPENEILERLNGIWSNSDITDIRRGDRYDQLSRDFISKLHDLPLEIIPLYDRTLDALTSEIQAQVHGGAKLVFVDYLQVFTPKMKSSDEFFEIKKTSERLRALALQHGVHLVVASSLNRSERQSERITLNSFYGSSGLGHDCSLGFILSGEQSDFPELVNPVRNVTLQVVKNRTGVRGDLSLKFQLRSQRFEETLSEQHAAVGFSDNGEEDNAF